MPRRIPDYPTGYNYWNNLMTLGSILTFISLILLFYLFWKTLFKSSAPQFTSFFHKG